MTDIKPDSERISDFKVKEMKFSQLFLLLAEQYADTSIGDINHGDLHGHGPEFSAEIELSEIDDSDPDDPSSYPFLAFQLQPDQDFENLVPSVVLCWWAGGEGVIDRVLFSLEPDSNVEQLIAWFDESRVDFEVSDEFRDVALSAFDEILRCANDAQSMFECTDPN